MFIDPFIAFVLVATLSQADLFDVLLKFLEHVAPVIGALGLWAVIARIGRALWAQIVVAAGKTPTKIDDFIVHLVEPAVEAGLDLVEHGDALAGVAKIRAAIAAAKAKAAR